MKNVLFIAALSSVSFSFSGCGDDGYKEEAPENYRQEMRKFVISISAYAKAKDPGFIIIPQNGHELLVDENGSVHPGYCGAIDGIGREDLFYGYNEDNAATPLSERGYMLEYMEIAVENGIEVLVTDYCWTRPFMDSSYSQSSRRGYISFAAESRELDIIPDYPSKPHNVNSSDVVSLPDARNFLYLLNPDQFATKSSFLFAVAQTDYDAVIMDLFFGDSALSQNDIGTLKRKANGGSRLVIAYMSIGEAEEYRYYWSSEWEKNPPSWLFAQNPDWEGNFKVAYWDASWQEIICGEGDSYLKKIMNAGFDGVYLDIIDAFEYFEELQVH